jgi:hypothetical protein
MSYENTSCPCGGKKPTDTMLCDDCEAYLANHPAMKYFKDPRESVESRRQSAIILVTVARGRKRHLEKQLAANKADMPHPKLNE